MILLSMSGVLDLEAAGMASRAARAHPGPRRRPLVEGLREAAMGTTTVVEAARRALGPVGVFLPFPFTSAPSADLQREAALRLGRASPQQAASAGGKFGSTLAPSPGYLDQMAAPTQLPAPDVTYPKIIGAN